MNIKNMVSALILLAAVIKPVYGDTDQADYDKLSYDFRHESVFIVNIRNVKKINWTLGSGSAEGLYLKVSCLKREYGVPVGPVVFLKNSREYKENRIIKITGITLKTVGDVIILPRLIRIGDDTYYIRNNNGKPDWESTAGSGSERKGISGERRGMGSRGGSPGGFR